MNLQDLMIVESDKDGDPEWDKLKLNIDDKYDYEASKDDDSVNDDVDNIIRITAVNPSGQVGYIEWDRDGGEIEKVYVGDMYRRKGVATHLWDEANDYVKDKLKQFPDARLAYPEHSSRRSEAGDGWANSVGGHVPDLDDDIDGWSTR